MECCYSYLIFCFLVISSFSSICAKAQLSEQYPSSANLSSSWVNSVGQRMKSPEWVTVNPILVRQNSGQGFICGFYCLYDSNSCLFAILIFQDENYPQLVWSANRNNPVGLNATLEFTEQGDLILWDADGTLVWSTNTSGMNVLGLNLTDYGDIVLFNTESSNLWDSFDQPTDSMLVGQWLDNATKLTASLSDSNWTQGLFSIQFTLYGFAAQLDSNPPQVYYEFKSGDSGILNNISTAQNPYFWYYNGGLSVLNNDDARNNLAIYIPYTESAQYMKLGGDGHLRVYQWQESTSTWVEAADLLKGKIDECGYPLVCGRYGICSPALTNGTSYLKPINEKQPNLGCSVFPPISCHLSQYHTLLELQDTDNYFFFRSDVRNIDIQICKQACLKNCSCTAALFKYNSNTSVGDCCLLSQVFSLQNIKNMVGTSNYGTPLFLKVQNKTEVAGNMTKTGKRTGHPRMVLGSVLGAFFGVFVCICACLLLLWKRRDSLEVEEDHLDWLQGMPTRFSYHELKASTKNFSCKLGEGGFGVVFEGILSNGMKVAVKRLEGLGKVKESFLAEVKTMGNIHHVNLVRLIGFCVEKSHRLLVYEYMCNGSLDKWIFHKNKDLTLCWQSRKKIILDIAKGLAYLHEDCMQKIFHLDIKPQNILLDEQLRAKVSDFGLSKLIEKDQSKVVTIMRGTPGYLAPEWLNSVITEKVDVYSFGVVVLEVLCGRRIIDQSQPEEDMHLLSIFKRKAEDEQLADIIDKESEDMQEHGEEVVEMMRMAAWCLQSDYSKRPSMSVVIKVLEGSVGVEVDLDYSNFPYSPILSGKSLAQGYKAASATTSASTSMLPFTLSGPR